MSFNFNGAKAATANNYVNPGIYKVKVTNVELGKFENKGTEYVGITFETEDGASFTEKFSFGSEKAVETSISRLQYLHEAWFTKPLAKDFDSLNEVASYFKKALTGKTIIKTIIVGGNKSAQGTVFASLPYAGFVIEDTDDVEYGEFDPKSPEYKKYVRVNNTTSEVSGKANGLLNEDNAVEIGGAKKGAAPKAEKVSPKKKAVKADDDDMPW